MKRQLTEEVLEQRKKISRFDEEIRKNEDILASGMVAFWGYVFAELLMFLVPIEEPGNGEGTIVFLAFLFSMECVMFYIRRYLYVTEERKNNPIWKKCRYLPISRKEFLVSRLRYLCRMQLKCVVVTVILQNVTALLVYGRITIWNVLYPIVFAGVLPFIMVFLFVVIACRDVTGKGRKKYHNSI